MEEIIETTLLTDEEKDFVIAGLKRELMIQQRLVVFYRQSFINVMDQYADETSQKQPGDEVWQQMLEDFESNTIN